MNDRQLVDGFLDMLRRRKSSPATVDAYRRILNGFLAFMAERRIGSLRNVVPEEVAAYRSAAAGRGLKSATLYQYMQKLGSFLEWLARERHIFVSPAEGMPLPRLERRLQPVPSERDILRLLAVPDLTRPTGLRDRAFIETAYSTGCRLGEMAGMDRADADLAEGTARVIGKGSRERVVPLGKVAAGWIRRYLQEARPALVKDDTGALWIGARGRRLNPRVVEATLRDYGRRAGVAVPLTPHSLRRACATHMLRGGAHPAQIQALLGHESLESLSRYLRVTARDLRQTHQNSRPGK